MKSDRAGGRVVRFGDLLLGRLALDISPVSRLPLSRADLLQHLETVADREERWRQLRQLTDCWRRAERRRAVCLLLLAELIRRRLVSLRAARHCLRSPWQPVTTVIANATTLAGAARARRTRFG